MIGPDGTVISRTGQFVAGTLVEHVPLRTTLMLANRLRAGPEAVMVGLGICALLVSVLAQRRRPRTGGS